MLVPRRCKLISFNSKNEILNGYTLKIYRRGQHELITFQDRCISNNISQLWMLSHFALCTTLDV